MWLTCWLGLVLVGLVAAIVDNRISSMENNLVPWLTFQFIMWGSVAVCFSQLAFLALERRPDLNASVFKGRSAKPFRSLRSDQSLPLLFAGSLTTMFALKGILLHPSSFWVYFSALAVLTAIIVVAGLMRQSGWLAFVSAGLAAIATIFTVDIDPENWFSNNQPNYPNALTFVLVLLSIVWSSVYVYRTVSDVKRFGRP